MNTEIKTFAIIGGDKRQLYCARAMADDGYEVILGGFDKVLSMRGVKLLAPMEAATEAQAIVLPLPSVNAQGNIPAFFSESELSFSRELQIAMSGKPVFCAMADKVTEKAPLLNLQLIKDYYAREDFVLSNAYVTAEGALKIAMEKFEGTLNGAKILVCGFGRIGKALVRLLSAFNPELTVSVRKPEDMSAVLILGAKAVKSSELYNLDEFDIIFSTVPALIFDFRLLAKISANAVLIDLASGEGSVDKSAAERLDIDYIHALSLPGKSSPKTAGEIIKNTVYTILEEEQR